MIVVITKHGALVDGELMSSLAAQEIAAQKQNSEVWDMLYDNKQEGVTVYKIHKEKLTLDTSPTTKIISYIERVGASKRTFSSATGISFRTLLRGSRALTAAELQKVKEFFPKIDMNWLLSNKP